MAPLDPSQLLKALNPLLGPTGAILGPEEAKRIASLMKDASKIVSKCVYMNILKLETPKEAMEKFLSLGGWDTLNGWLQEFKDGENHPLLTEILKVYKTMPVTVDILKKNNAAKTIKQLCKSENDNVKTLASTIFDEWMKKVKNNNNNSANSDPKAKKKKKDKEKDDKGESSSKSSDKDSKSDKSRDKSDRTSSEKSDRTSIDKSSDKSDSDKSRSKDVKSSHHHHSHSHHSHHRHHSGDHTSSSSSSSSHAKDRDKKSESSTSRDRRSIDDSDSSSNQSNASEEVVSVKKGSGLKLTIKLGSDKEKKDSTDKTEHDKKRPSTVKRPPSKFRSTG